jgi:hypothetical protein
MRAMRDAYILVGKPKGMRSPKRRSQDNIKMEFMEIGFTVMDWIHFVQDRRRWWSVVKRVMSLWVPKVRTISCVA